MTSKISRRKAITYLLIAVSVIVTVLICPLNMIRYGYTAKSDEVIVSESDPISVEYNMAQMFDGIGGELKSVDLYVCNDMSNQIITFRLYDENHEQIYEQFYNVSNEFVAPDFIHIPIRYEMEQGKEYSFIVEGLTTDLYCAYEDRETTTSPVNYFMAYGGAVVPEYDLVVRYNYARPFGIVLSLISVLALAGLCVATWFVLGKFEDKVISIKKMAQLIINPVLAVLALLAAYVIQVKKIFGIDTKNNLFLILGVWLLLGIIAIVINLGDIQIPENIKDKIKSISIGRVIRVISIATVIWYCYEYMNGLYDIFHRYSTAKLFIAFAFVLISSYSKKEVLNIPNAIWLVIGPIIAYFTIYKPMVGVELFDELYRQYAWLMVVAGFVAINIVYSIVLICKKQIKPRQIDLRFAIPFVVLAIGLCVLANGRTWTWQLVLMCALVIYRLCVSENSDSFTKDLCSGVILNFYMMVWFSLKHRPYYFYQFYRFNMGYHTVTVTAYYLALIASAAFLRLIEGYNVCKNIIKLIPRMFTIGMVMSYLIFTMSRTGFLSVGAMITFGIGVMILLYVEKNKIRIAGQYIAVIALAVIYMFPVTFFLQDVMPRIANAPIAFEIEVRDFTFSEGMPLSDSDYMTIEQFVREFGRKVFNIDPDEVKEAKSDNPFVIKAYAAEQQFELESHKIELPFMLDDKDDEAFDVSNGRLDIFKAYISQWNLWGHEDMDIELPNGELIVHAHNSFLQIAHDHGIILGVYFVLFIGYVMLLSLYKAYKVRENMYGFFCPLVLVSFCMASLVEWIFHMSNPFGLVTILAMMPLIIKDSCNE